MLNRKSAWLRAVAPAAVLALALTACGSDDSDDTSDDAAPEQSTEEETEEPQEDLEEEDAPEGEEEEDAEGGSGTAHEQFEGMDPVLEGLSIGDFGGPITVDGAEMWMKVDKVDVGAPEDFGNEDVFDPEDYAGLKPAYLHMTFVHVGGEELTSEKVVGDATVHTVDGERATPLILIGVDMPGGCPRGGNSDDFSVGAEATQCDTVAIDEGAEPGSVIFYGDDQVELEWALN